MLRDRTISLTNNENAQRFTQNNSICFYLLCGEQLLVHFSALLPACFGQIKMMMMIIILFSFKLKLVVQQIAVQSLCTTNRTSAMRALSCSRTSSGRTKRYNLDHSKMRVYNSKRTGMFYSTFHHFVIYTYIQCVRVYNGISEQDNNEPNVTGTPVAIRHIGVRAYTTIKIVRTAHVFSMLHCITDHVHVS